MYPITKPQTGWQLCKVITRLWISNIHFMSWFLILEILGTIGTLMTGRFLMMYILSSDISLATVISYWIAVLCMVAGVPYIKADIKIQQNKRKQCHQSCIHDYVIIFIPLPSDIKNSKRHNIRNPNRNQRSPKKCVALYED